MNSQKALRQSRVHNREIRISSIEELHPLLLRFTLTGLRSGYVVLNMPWLNDEENTKYSEQFNRHYKACGCSEGTLGGLVGTVVGVFFFLSNRWLHSLSTTKSALVATGIVFCFMALGKAYGLLSAKRKLLKTIVEITKTKTLFFTKQ